jgi:hypothetical protein
VWLSELAFQGFFGVDRATRVHLGPGLCRRVLPDGIDPDSFPLLLRSLLYPQLVTRDDLAVLPEADAARLGVSASLLVPGREGVVHSVSRRAASESVVVTEAVLGGEPREIARGAAAVAKLMLEVHGVPPDPSVFWSLHAGQFGQFGPVVGDPETQELVRRYRCVVEIERTEQELDEVEARISEVVGEKERLEGLVADTGGSVRGRLAAIEEVLSADPGDLDVVRGHQDALAVADDRARHLRAEVGASGAADTVNPLWRDGLFMGCVVAATVVAAVSVLTDVRMIALANLCTLTVGAWAVLRWYGRRELAAVAGVRREQLARGVKTAQEKRAALVARFDSVLARLGLDSVESLAALEGERDDLLFQLETVETPAVSQEEVLHRLEEIRVQLPVYQGQSECLNGRLAALGGRGVASCELGGLLQARGVDLGVIIRGQGPLSGLVQAAESRGQWASGQLMDGAGAMFRRALVHLVSEGFGDAKFTGSGEIVSSAGGLESEDTWLGGVAVVSGLLASAPPEIYGCGRFLMVSLPLQGLGAGQKAAVNKVLDQLGRRGQVVLLERAS